MKRSIFEYGILGIILAGLFFVVHQSQRDQQTVSNAVAQMGYAQEAILKDWATFHDAYQSLVAYQDRIVVIDEQIAALQTRIVELQGNLVTMGEEQLWLLSQPQGARPQFPMPQSMRTRFEIMP